MPCSWWVSKLGDLLQTEQNGMKHVLLTLLLVGTAFMSKAQEASVEKSTSGIQTGVLGLWLHNEERLSNQFALRTELGFDNEFFEGRYGDGIGFVLALVLTLEPRWYYNLNSRSLKSKRISGNSGNFFSLKSSYHPDWFVISNDENISVLNQLTIIPTWGLRRNVGEHFTYETGVGFGYRYIFAKSAGYPGNQTEKALNLHLRLGYRF
jgi:hypothetical protein